MLICFALFFAVFSGTTSTEQLKGNWKDQNVVKIIIIFFFHTELYDGLYCAIVKMCKYILSIMDFVYASSFYTLLSSLYSG